MSKIKLRLDTLQVDTFQTAGSPDAARGTVQAHAITGFTSYCQCAYATNYGTCQASCADTCGGPTCDYPCQTADTCYLTCRDACAWTDGYQVCKQTP